MSLWTLSEVPTVNKINQKTVFIGTTAPSSPQDGQFWLDTSANPYTLKMYHASVALWRIVEIPIKKVKMPIAVAADYSTPSGTPVASSEGAESPWTSAATSTGSTQQDTTLYSGSIIRAGSRVVPGASGWDVIGRMRFSLKKTGSPTGTAYARIYRKSDGALLKTVGSIDVSTLTTLYVDYFFADGSNINLNSASEIYYVIEYSAGDASNNIQLKHWDTGTGGAGVTYVASWSEEVNSRHETELFNGTKRAATNAKDDGTSTYWLPGPYTEASAYIYFDIGSIQLVSGCRIYWLASSEIPSSFNIDISEDASAWTNVKAITTAQTANAWNEYSWNTKRARYIRIQVVSYGSATVIKVAEADFYATITDRTIAEHGHGDAV